MIVLGLDPGTATTGYGVIQLRSGKLSCEGYGCLTTPAGVEPAKRLEMLHRQLVELLRDTSIDAVAVERLFFNRNVRTALAVGEARGVILLAAAQTGLPIGEYTPLEVKQAVAGHGKAPKDQVQFMVKTILGLPALPRPDDAADALAVAICHQNSRGLRERMAR